jgi:hypothetical protein
MAARLLLTVSVLNLLLLFSELAFNLVGTVLFP